VGNSKKNVITYYVSAHGYGHGVRSCDIIRALNRLYPDVTVDVVSGLPPGFLFNRISSAQNNLRNTAFDLGMVQKDSIRVDVRATLAGLERLYERSEESIEREAQYLEKRGVAAVICDIPELPMEAAAIAGVPRVAVGNFGWDWIYAGFAGRDSRWTRIVERIRGAYGKSDLLLRLPFSDAMEAFPVIEDIPLVASPGNSRRNAIAELAGCDNGKRWILISFTSLTWGNEALDRIERLKDCEFFTVHPLAWSRRNIHMLHREQLPFSDIVASVDAVVSKPGFGILSDCVVNRKPLIYADRSDFPEFAVLEAAIRRYLKHVHIPASDLYRGDIAPSLARIWDRPEPGETLPHGGDLIAARRIVGFAGIGN
jgi:L-arabinokinase